MSKIKSMALYLPQENALTGQLEFLPAVLYPHPDTDGRVFIAGDSESKFAPSLPRTLTKLPGFAVAQSLLPGYPMVSSSSATDVGVGAVEEVFCHVPTGKGRNGKGGGGGAALSVPLLSGSQTVGVLLVSPSDDALSQNPEEESSMNRSEDDDNDSEGENWPPVVSVWTESDRMQVARAAKSLSLALSMDTERLALQRHNQYVKEALSESLHQIKNPLQALRTYGKLLQQRIAEADAAPLSPPLSPSYVRSATSLSSSSSSNQLLELADHLLVQSDRLSQRLQPVDWIVDSMDDSNDGTNKPPLLLLRPAEERSLVRWTAASSDKAGAGSSLALTESATFPSASSTLNSDRISDSDRNGDSQLTSKDQPLTDDATVAHRSPASRLFLMPSPEMEMSFPEDVLEPVLSAFRAIAADRDIQFEVDASDDDDVPGVTVSSQAVQEAVSNLLDNAFKYVMAVVPSEGSRAPRKPRVRVRIRPNPSKQSATAGAGAGGATAAAGATILIEDNGPGITDSELELVWKRGYRGESAIRSGADGSGLGLYIARSLVEGMGGTLRVLSQREASRLGCLPGTAVEVVLFRDPPASAQRS
jgi:signal transduction histidine kinase